jgi:hypothetical protein
MRYLVDDIELFDRNLIDLIQAVYARYVYAVALDNVDEVVNGRVAPQYQVGVVYLVFAQDRAHRFQVELSLGHLDRPENYSTSCESVFCQRQFNTIDCMLMPPLSFFLK